jgi:hypothetical protein
MRAMRTISIIRAVMFMWLSHHQQWSVSWSEVQVSPDLLTQWRSDFEIVFRSAR